MNIDVRVSQGGNKAHLVYILYLKSLMRATNAIKFYLSADGTCATVTSTKTDSAIDTLNIELHFVVIWLKPNHLSLNVFKSSFALFHTNKK